MNPLLGDCLAVLRQRFVYSTALEKYVATLNMSARQLRRLRKFCTHQIEQLHCCLHKFSLTSLSEMKRLNPEKLGSVVNAAAASVPPPEVGLIFWRPTPFPEPIRHCRALARSMITSRETRARHLLHQHKCAGLRETCLRGCRDWGDREFLS